MERAVNNRRLAADILHDVDLAAVGPPGGTDVVAQHPKRRPYALAVGNLQACFKSTVGLRELVSRQQPRGSVIPSYVVTAGISFFQRLYNQRAILDDGIRGAIRVGLKFVVTPAVTADVESPLCRVDCRAIR